MTPMGRELRTLEERKRRRMRPGRTERERKREREREKERIRWERTLGRSLGKRCTPWVNDVLSGFFEFALCPRNDSTPEDDDCFENLKVKSMNSTEIFVEEDNLRYRLKSDRKGLFYLAATLPKEVTCSKCILRWHWR